MVGRKGKLKRSSLAVLLLVSLAILSPQWVDSALAQVSLIPKIQEVDVNRGGRVRFDLQVANRGNEPLTFTMGAYDLAITVAGIPSARRDRLERSCVDWISMEPSSFELFPGEVQIVKGLVHAPKESAGGYSAFLTAEFNIKTAPMMIDEEEKLEAEIHLGRAVSSILLITSQSSKNFVKIEPDSLLLFSGQVVEEASQLLLEEADAPEGWHASLTVKNTGNIHALASGEMSLWHENARLVERASLTAGRGYVLPGEKRIFQAEGSKPLADGIYMAKVQIRTKQGRLTQGTFPYSIVNGDAIPGAATDEIRALIKASTPTFSLSKRMLDFKISPKGKRTQGIRIQNYGPDMLTIEPRIVDWSLDEEGKVTLDPDPRNLGRSCSSWLTVSPASIVIPPRRSQSAKIAVQAPADMKGEYYAGVRFDAPDYPSDLPSELELPRTLMMTVSTMRGLDYMTEIESFEYKAISPLMRVFIVNVLNTGNVHCYVSGKLEFYDLEFNRVLDPVHFGGRTDYVLPDRIRGYAVPCPGALDPGTYEAVVMINYQDGNPEIVENMIFDVHEE